MNSNDKKINLIHIGRSYCGESGTSMSLIYEKNTWKRFDFNSLDRALIDGYKVTITPANKKEIAIANKMLILLVIELQCL